MKNLQKILIPEIYTEKALLEASDFFSAYARVDIQKLSPSSEGSIVRFCVHQQYEREEEQIWFEFLNYVLYLSIEEKLGLSD